MADITPVDGGFQRAPLQGCSAGTVPLINFDVFINHRGPDVKKTLVGHLAAALKTANFSSFVDHEGIQIGDTASEVIQSAIHNSKIHVSVFSPGYAESPWCLDELRLMMECSRNKSSELFLPVFFFVIPSDLRLLMPSRKSWYDSAFEEHARTYGASTIHHWKQALHEASTFKGYIFPDDFQGFEAKLVDSIVSKVIKVLSKSTLLHGPEHPIGLDEKVQEALVCMKSTHFQSDIQKFGIYGMGGLGKTTLARSIYNRIHREFESACFIQNVSESCRNTGLTGLQKDLLQQLLKPTRELFIPNTGFGRQMIQERLVGKRVLIILDDVSEKKQLDELMPPMDCGLHRSSQIVITTRDREVLMLAQVKKCFPMKGLSRDCALQLLNLHAFPSTGESSTDPKLLQTERKSPVDCKTLVEKVADACHGLPLALEVLGSHLRGKNTSIWESTVKVLEKEEMVDSQRVVTQILRVSFDALRSNGEKEMFLDAACFLFQEPMEKAMRIWRSDYGESDAKLYLNNLICKCLVKLDKNGDLTLHGLLRDMGREIVDNSGKPYWEKSHLWRKEDVDRVLEKQKGTSYVRGLGSNTQKEWDTSSFTGMDELKLLVLDNVTLTGDFGNIPQELSLFQMRYCLLKVPDLLLALENVAVLDLEGCQMTSFSCGDSKLQNLKELNLNNCSKLIELLIDFSKSSKSLEVLSLSQCVNLEGLPGSLCELSSSLTYLDVSWCTKLTALPDAVGKLTALCKIRLDGAGLMTLPQSFGSLSSLVLLRLCHSSLRHLPSTIGKLSNLAHCDLSKCESISQLPEGLGSLKRLVELHLYDMKSLVALPCSISLLFMLKVLNLEGCCNLGEIRELPTSLTSLVVGGCTSLKCLDTSACSKLQALPDGLETLHNLCHLSLGGYTSEQMLGTVQIQKLTSLKTLRLSQEISNVSVENNIRWIQRLVSIEEVVVGCVTSRLTERLLIDRSWSRSLSLEKVVRRPLFSTNACRGVVCWFIGLVGRDADGQGLAYAHSEQSTVEVVSGLRLHDDQAKFSQLLMRSQSRLQEEAQLHVAIYRASHPLVACLSGGDTIRVRCARNIVRGSIELRYTENEMQQTLSHLIVCEASDPLAYLNHYEEASSSLIIISESSALKQSELSGTNLQNLARVESNIAQEKLGSAPRKGGSDRKKHTRSGSSLNCRARKKRRRAQKKPTLSGASLIFPEAYSARKEPTENGPKLEKASSSLIALELACSARKESGPKRDKASSSLIDFLEADNAWKEPTLCGPNWLRLSQP